MSGSDDLRPVSDQDAIRARQKSRALVTGMVLGALVILFYAIALVKMTGG